MSKKVCKELKSPATNNLSPELKDKLFEITMSELAKTLNEGVINCTYQHNSKNGENVLNYVRFIDGKDLMGCPTEYGCIDLLEMIIDLIGWINDPEELYVISDTVNEKMKKFEEEDCCNCCKCEDECFDEEDDKNNVQRKVVGLHISDDEVIELHYIKKVSRCDNCEDEVED